MQERVSQLKQQQKEERTASAAEKQRLEHLLAQEIEARKQQVIQLHAELAVKHAEYEQTCEQHRLAVADWSDRLAAAKRRNEADSQAWAEEKSQLEHQLAQETRDRKRLEGVVVALEVEIKSKQKTVEGLNHRLAVSLVLPLPLSLIAISLLMFCFFFLLRTSQLLLVLCCWCRHCSWSWNKRGQVTKVESRALPHNLLSKRPVW